MTPRLSKQDISELAERIGWFSVSDAEAAEYADLSAAVLEIIDQVATAPAEANPVFDSSAAAGIRDAGRQPLPDEDPLNAIVRWCAVSGAASDGPLAGLRFAIKDSVAVAGVPLTLGSTVLRDFTPPVDSVVVERILRDGGEIVAMANMDGFAFSGGGDSSGYGPIRNPFDPARSAGGSSGGSAAALYYTGAVDAAIGCDQGGSIRLPAAWCGVVGLKPTHSLVPYTGIAGIDATFDHVGPMARSAVVLGRLLASIAGAHPSDPRQRDVHFDRDELLRVTRSTDDSFEGLRVGLLVEGFTEDNEPRKKTSAAIRRCAQRLAEAGAIVDEVSVPAHLQGGGIAFAGFIEGMASLTAGGGNGYHWVGRYAPEFAQVLADALRDRGGELPPQMKLVTLLGDHLRRQHGGAVYATAQNQRPWLRRSYDKALDNHDVLLLPTAPYPAYEHDATLTMAERVLRGWEPLGNCAPLDMTGHPAISLPVATVDGLPVGAMLVGPRFSDTRLVDIACRYERRFGWDPVITDRQDAGGGPAAPPVSTATR